MRHKTIDNDILYNDILRPEILQQMGDPLEQLNSIINWEIFRPKLELIYEKDWKSNAGASSHCPILMFKILILQRLDVLHLFGQLDKALIFTT
ncbi:hypothetical protein K4L44_05225 [Halosquirtibacter laminarini]|uniref:Uncharacterized protein n=1 Tax=Halosquirtibacter laminarini TaxID=3374600 RepID=A0AC61NQ59_9BACT|nr:hypothetical protein K4L44_05225 [Prolixibacteraceae bacterium]